MGFFAWTTTENWFKVCWPVKNEINHLTDCISRYLLNLLIIFSRCACRELLFLWKIDWQLNLTGHCQRVHSFSIVTSKKTTQVVKKISPALTVRTWWFVHLDILCMLWFSFILGLHFIFLCFKLIIIHYHTPKQRKIKFKPRMKLNHNIYIKRREKKNRQSTRVSAFLPEWLIFLHRKSLLFEWEPVEWIFIFHVLCDRFKRIFFCWNNNKNRGDNIP